MTSHCCPTFLFVFYPFRFCTVQTSLSCPTPDYAPYIMTVCSIVLWMFNFDSVVKYSTFHTLACRQPDIHVRSATVLSKMISLLLLIITAKYSKQNTYSIVLPSTSNLHRTRSFEIIIDFFLSIFLTSVQQSLQILLFKHHQQNITITW